MRKTLTGLFLIGIFAFSALSCGLLSEEQLEELDSFINILTGAPIKEPLTGQNAFVYLDKDDSRAPDVDRNAVMGALRTADDSAELSDPGFGAVDILQKNIRAKQGIKAEKFSIPGDDAYPPPPAGGFDNRLSINLGSLQDELMIPHLEAIPVRNQGERGTCAAFAGIGHVEHKVLLEKPGLGTVDLSEQRFYYNSKPECHSSGCSLMEEGSWYADGMEASIDAASYDIPREAECPYNDSMGSNDVQVPQLGSCSTGAVKIVQLKYVQDPGEIASVLDNDGLPVPYASKLSDNWRWNDGLITHASSDAGTVDKHSGGHAYLIVGYRKLPNLPDEGGMCFIIKNSWGTGWGVNGFSCMTLAWMETWGMNYLEQPVVMDVMINEDLLAAEDTTPDPVPDYFDPDTYDDETVDWDDIDDGDEDEIPEPEPDPEPRPEPWTPNWVSTAIKGPDDHFYRIEKTDGPGQNEMTIRGFIRNTGTSTGELLLEVDGEGLYFDGDRVGDLKSDHLVLCTGPYDVLCSLRLDKDENKLYVEFVNPEYRRVKPDQVEEGNWEALLDVEENGFGLEFFNADDLEEQLIQRFIFVRLTDAQGEKTEAMRLSLDGFAVKLMGETIGSIEPSNLGLCSGSHAKNCKLYRGRNGLTIVPKARPKQ